MRLIKFLSAVALLVFAFSVGCRHELILPEAPDGPYVNPNDTIPDLPVDTADYSGVPCSPDTVYFQNQVLPLLISGCAKAGCHDAISHKEGVTLIDYTTVKANNKVKAFNPTQSKLYTVLNATGEDRMPPPPDAAFTADQKALIYKWIQQGALNNVCNEGYGGCDTTGITYTNYINPLMANKCNGCHSGANPSGGIKLTTYTEVKASAQSGGLIGSINWSAGYKAMPDGGAKLSTCQIDKVKAWFNAGMPQ